MNTIGNQATAFANDLQTPTAQYITGTLSNVADLAATQMKYGQAQQAFATNAQQYAMSQQSLLNSAQEYAGTSYLNYMGQANTLDTQERSTVGADAAYFGARGVSSSFGSAIQTAYASVNAMNDMKTNLYSNYIGDLDKNLSETSDRMADYSLLQSQENSRATQSRWFGLLNTAAVGLTQMSKIYNV